MKIRLIIESNRGPEGFSEDDKEMFDQIMSLINTGDFSNREQAKMFAQSLEDAGDPVGIYVVNNILPKLIYDDLEYVIKRSEKNLRDFYTIDSTGYSPLVNILDLYPEILEDIPWLRRRMERYGPPEEFTGQFGGRKVLGLIKKWLVDEIEGLEGRQR